MDDMWTTVGLVGLLVSVVGYGLGYTAARASQAEGRAGGLIVLGNLAYLPTVLLNRSGWADDGLALLIAVNSASGAHDWWHLSKSAAAIRRWFGMGRKEEG